MSFRSGNRVGMSVALVAGFCLIPMSAHAHLVQTGFGTFYDGMVHLVLTPADLLIVLGFWRDLAVRRRHAGLYSPCRARGSSVG